MDDELDPREEAWFDSQRSVGPSDLAALRAFARSLPPRPRRSSMAVGLGASLIALVLVGTAVIATRLAAGPDVAAVTATPTAPSSSSPAQVVPAPGATSTEAHDQWGLHFGLVEQGAPAPIVSKEEAVLLAHERLQLDSEPTLVERGTTVSGTANVTAWLIMIERGEPMNPGPTCAPDRCEWYQTFAVALIDDQTGDVVDTFDFNHWLPVGARPTPSIILDPDPTTSPSPSPTASGDCINSLVEYDRFIPTIADAAGRATKIFIGTVIEVMPSRWKTPDGLRPPNPGGSGMIIVTPAVLSVDVSIRGVETTTITVDLAGGQIGCDRIFVGGSGTPSEAHVGERYAVLLSPYGDPPAFSAEMWMVIAGKVHTSRDGDVSIADFVAAVSATK